MTSVDCLLEQGRVAGVARERLVQVGHLSSVLDELSRVAFSQTRQSLADVLFKPEWAVLSRRF